MAKKRKSDPTRLDEVDRSMYTSFCSAANSLSQLYTQSMNQQRLSFQAGERNGLEKLYDWILRQQEDGSRVNATDIVTYLQNELEYGLEETPVPPRSPFQHQNHSQTALHSTNTGLPVSFSSFGPTTVGQGLGLRSGHSDNNQAKPSVFSSALSSPVRRSLQQYHLSQGGFDSSNSMPPGNGPRSNETGYSHHQIRDSNTLSSNDSLMDMHADSPGRGSSY
ncbi:hypothetical protein U1Q18_011179 [Sarracenia purpurea var. burkii]